MFQFNAIDVELYDLGILSVVYKRVIWRSIAVHKAMAVYRFQHLRMEYKPLVNMSQLMATFVHSVCYGFYKLKQ